MVEQQLIRLDYYDGYDTEIKNMFDRGYIIKQISGGDKEYCWVLFEKYNNDIIL